MKNIFSFILLLFTTLSYILNGIIKKSYNSSSVSISNVEITGALDIELYSSQNITIGNNTTIGGGVGFLANIANCPSEF